MPYFFLQATLMQLGERAVIEPIAPGTSTSTTVVVVDRKCQQANQSSHDLK